MTRSELVDRCKRIIEEAYQEATEMIVAFLEKHPNESETGICKEVDPDNWSALRSRVQRLRQKRRSEQLTGSTISEPSESFRGAVRGAKSGIRRHPELVDDLLKDPDVRSEVEKRIAADDESTRRINREAARLHDTPERVERPRPTVDYDQRYQDAVAEIVYREADRKSGRWEPNDRTLAARHFLLRALNDPGSVEADSLVDEITRYLKEVAS